MAHIIDGADASLHEVAASPLDELKNALFVYTAYTQYGNHVNVIEAAWQNTCDAFESAIEERDYAVPACLRLGVMDARFSSSYGQQDKLNALPFELILSQGDKLFPQDSEIDNNGFVSLLKACVQSRIQGETVPGGQETAFQAKFEASRIIEKYLTALKHGTRSPAPTVTVYRLERIVEQARLAYRPIIGRVLKAGSLAVEAARSKAIIQSGAVS